MRRKPVSIGRDADNMNRFSDQKVREYQPDTFSQ